MTFKCPKCEAEIVAEDLLIEHICACGAKITIKLECVESEDIQPEKAKGLLGAVEGGMDIDKAIDLYLGDK